MDGVCSPGKPRIGRLSSGLACVDPRPCACLCVLVLAAYLQRMMGFLLPLEQERTPTKIIQSVINLNDTRSVTDLIMLTTEMAEISSGTTPNNTLGSPPPPGITPNFDDPPSQLRAINAVVISCLTIATIFAWLRLYTKVFVKRSYGSEDCKRAYGCCYNLDWWTLDTAFIAWVPITAFCLRRKQELWSFRRPVMLGTARSLSSPTNTATADTFGIPY